MTAKKPRIIKPLEMTKDSVISHMRTFRGTAGYEVISGLWGMEREQILEEGKRTLKAEVLSELKGFDRAAQMVTLWAKKLTKAEREDSDQREDGE